MPALVPGIHVFACGKASRGWPGYKGVHTRLRRAMPGHDGCRSACLTLLWPGAGKVHNRPARGVANGKVDAAEGRAQDVTSFARRLKNTASFFYKGALRCRCQLSRELRLLQR